MPIPIEFSDGQKVDASLITCVHLFMDDPRLLVELKAGAIKVFGPGVEADAAMLDAVRDENHLNYGVFKSYEGVRMTR